MREVEEEEEEEKGGLRAASLGQSLETVLQHTAYVKAQTQNNLQRDLPIHLILALAQRTLSTQLLKTS